MFAKLIDMIFKQKSEPVVQRQEPPPVTVKALSPLQHVLHPVCNRQMIVDEMMAWVADCGEEYTRRTMYAFMNVHDGTSNLMYAVKNGEIVGFVIFRFAQRRVFVERLAVNPVHRRCGVGRHLLDVVQSSLTPYRETAVMRVPVEFLPAQFFLRSCGWKATGEKDGRIKFELKFRTHDNAL